MTAQRHPHWGEDVDITFDSWVLDEPWRFTLQDPPIDPVVALASARLTGDKEAARRGLMFVGEVRRGDLIYQQFRRPTFWRRVRYAILRPRREKPMGSDYDGQASR